MARTNLEQALSRCINMARETTMLTEITIIKATSSMVSIPTVHQTTKSLLALNHERAMTSPNEFFHSGTALYAVLVL